jgi:outer membrane protein assembly factor BamA
MRRTHIAVFSSVIFAVSCTLLAQTYTPKTIRIDAPPGTDTAEPLRIAALPANAPLTKEQIETALGRLADTGLFSDISYTVNAAALVIKLTPAASSQSLPVRYGNLVWWQPGELEPLVEARVPIFKGKLPASGTLTEQVEAILVDLLHQKGIDAKVTANLVQDVPGGPLAATDLTLSHPQVVVGDIHLQNGIHVLDAQTSKFDETLHNEDFDTGETYSSIHLSVADIYQNGGYLDVATTTPTYSAPHKDLDHYVVDLTAAIQPGEIYHISRITLQPAPPLSESEILKAAEIKPGDHVSPLAQRIAVGEIGKAYSDRGYLDAKADFHSSKNATDRTLAYDVAITPGEIYHFAAVDTSALTPGQQAAFAKDFHATPGVIADASLRNNIFHAMQSAGLLHTVSFAMTGNRADHTVTYSLKPAPASERH